MDPIATLAASTVAVLAPYLAKAGEEIAKETGKVAVNKIGVLYEAIRNRFKNKPTAEEALADLETQPNDKDAQAALRHQLKKQMKVDPILTDRLQKLINEIGQDEKAMSFLVQVYGGEVKNIIQISEVDKLIIK